HRGPGMPCNYGDDMEAPRRRTGQVLYRQPRVDAQSHAGNQERSLPSQDGRQPQGKEHSLSSVDRAARKHPNLPCNSSSNALRSRRCVEKMLSAAL
ncbi:hypothetical protein IWW45_003835, partial [Coemansia sp. RSA 485]